MVQLDTFIRKAMTDEKEHWRYFFYLEKGSDLDRGFEILKNMHNIGLCGRLPYFARNILRDRGCQVRVSSEKSKTSKLNIWFPQRSMLSVTLFAIKINLLRKSLY